jgi:hypothetical protein
MVVDMPPLPRRGDDRATLAIEDLVSDWREVEVGNETRSRELNEWANESSERSEEHQASPYVCECSDESCRSTISLTHRQYEEVRADGTHFAIALDHESPDLDLLISEHLGFAIIRKLPGFPARLALASDPRRIEGRTMS